MFFFEKRITKDSNHLLIIKKRIGHQSMKTDNRFCFLPQIISLSVPISLLSD